MIQVAKEISLKKQLTFIGLCLLIQMERSVRIRLTTEIVSEIILLIDTSHSEAPLQKKLLFFP